MRGAVLHGARDIRFEELQEPSRHQAAIRQKAGRIRAGNDRIDDAYRAKYATSSYLAPMVSARARSATVSVRPRDTSSPDRY